MQVLSRRENAANIASTAALGDHTRHLIALRLLPFLFLMYIVNYLDRTNLAFAALEMSHDLGFSDRVFGLGAGMFFVSYVALQIPGTMLVESWGARRSVSTIMIAWGSLTVLTGAIHNALQLYAARFVLGAAEAAFFPGVVVYMSHWFIREDRAKAGSNFMAAIPISFVIGSPVAGWIVGQHWLGMEGRRWMFVLEGAPAIVLGAVAYFFLTDHPTEAAWLSGDQRRWVTEKLEEEKATGCSSATPWQAIKSPTVVKMAAATFLSYFVGYTTMFWMPTMLKRLSGFPDALVGLLGIVPYATGLVAMLVNGWHSDKTGERCRHAATAVFCGGIGVLGLLIMPHSTALAVALFSVVCINLAYLPVFWAVPTEMLSESVTPAAVAWINAVGSVAGFAGPYVFGYLRTVTGSYSAGLTLMVLSAMTGVTLLLRIARQNDAAQPSTAGNLVTARPS